jgi:hypothetical protein
MTIALAISGLIRPMLEAACREGLDVRWFMTPEQALEAVEEAEIGWFDMNDQRPWSKPCAPRRSSSGSIRSTPGSISCRWMC